MKNYLIFLALIISIHVYAVCPKIRYVTPEGAGLKNGSSWSNAYDSTKLQAAINEVGVNQVWVAAGTYTPTVGNDPTISFNMKSGVAIYGGFSRKETSINERINYDAGQVNETILSADLRGDDFTNGSGYLENSYHVIYNSGVNNTALLDGFTITRGKAERTDEDRYFHCNGAGIYNISSSPKINNCTITGNYASGGGGGVYDTISSPAYTNCRISGNHGGQIAGGGVFNSLSSPVFINCIIRGNDAEAGAGVFNENHSSPAFTNCIISGNSADGRGGGMCNVNSTIKLTNCLILNNHNYVIGGGVYNYQSSVSLTNCTISGNFASQGGGMSSGSSSVKIYNSIIWGNDIYEAIGRQILNGGGTCELNYSCYGNDTNDVTNYGTFIADSNCIITSPKFVNADTSDYRIFGFSPCINAGNNAYNTEAFDIRGQVRIKDETIDMGAYEWNDDVDPFGVLFTWTGNSSTRWDDAGNWDVGFVPSGIDEVTVPDVMNDPIISNPLIYPAECHDLTIETGSVLTLNTGGALTIHGNLINDNIPGYSNLVVKSDGSLITNSAAAATFKRFISGWSNEKHGWQLLSSPIQNQGITKSFTDDIPSEYNFFQWDEPLETWLNQKEISNKITNFIPGTGYRVSYHKSGNRRFEGHLNKTDIPISGLTNTISNTVHGWHLLGNPFPCAARWNDGNWALANIMGTAKLWKESYASFVDIAAHDIIPSTNGFMVETSGDGSIVIPLASRVHDTTHYVGGDTIITLTAYDALYNTAQETIIKVNSRTTEKFDTANDSHFLAGYAPQFYSIKDSQKLSTINIFKFDDQKIHLEFVKNEAGDFSIELKTLGVDTGQMIYLTDKKNGVTTNLQLTPVYNFSSADGDDTDRFLLGFKDITSVPREVLNSLKVYEKDGTITILADPSLSGWVKVTVTDITGRTIAIKSLIPGIPLHFRFNHAPGIYLVSLLSKTQTFSQKIVLK